MYFLLDVEEEINFLIIIFICLDILVLALFVNDISVLVWQKYSSLVVLGRDWINLK